MSTRKLLLSATALALAACQPAPSAPDVVTGSGPTLVVATFQGNTITAADVDARVLALPGQDRPKPGEDLDAWFAQQVRQIAVDRLLSEEAAQRQLDQEPQFLAARRDAEAGVVSRRCLATLKPGIGQVTPEELHTLYESEKDTFAQPERRTAFHIYKRIDATRGADAARAEIEALRERVLRGENFQRLATKQSDSESRHSGGLINTVIPGQLPTPLESIIFALDEGVPSEPMVSANGVHLFYVDKILPARAISFEEARDGIRARLSAERFDADMAEVLADVPASPDDYMISQQEFADVAKQQDETKVLLRIADRQITLGDLRRVLGQVAARNQQRGQQDRERKAAWAVLEGLRQTELLYRHCRQNDLVSAEETEAQLRHWQQNSLLGAIRTRRLRELAAADEAALTLYYQSNVGRFSTTPRWKLRHARFPIGDDAVALMATLEAAATANAPSLAELAERLGGAVEEWDWTSLPELRSRQPKLAPLVSPLHVGHISAPIRTPDALELVEVVDREEATPKPFDEVRDQVIAAYIEQYEQSVYAALSEQLLAKADFRIDPASLDALRSAGLPQADVSVEQLEAAFGDL